MVPAPENESLRPPASEALQTDVLVEPRVETPQPASDVAQYVQPISTTPPPVVQDLTGQTVLQSAPQAQAITITLPMDEDQAREAEKHSSPTQGIFWLAKWCEYMLNKARALGIKVLYLASRN